MKRSFTEELLGWKKRKDRKPLIVRGVRQVGKTYILQEFGANYFPKTHYINFEKQTDLAKVFEKNLDPLRIIKDLSFSLNQPIDVKRDLVIFDEIQACPKALTSLKYFQEELPGLHLCSAGSLLGVHLTPVSFPVGKVDLLTLYPMSFEEFLLAIDEQRSITVLQQWKRGESLPEIVHRHLFDQLKIYFVVGGLPEAVKVYRNMKDAPYEAMDAVRGKQETLISTYHADMAKHSGKVNAMHLDRVWRSIPNQLAQSQDGSTSKYQFKGVLPGVSRYSRLVNAIDWLEGAGLIVKVPIVQTAKIPLASHVKENIFKLFCFDVGILGAMSDLMPKTILDYDYGSYKGYFAENFVLQEFLCAGAKKLYCWEKKTAEVEFLKEEDGAVIPIEVKSGWVTKAKSLDSFRKQYDSPFAIILSAKNIQFEKRRKTYCYPLYLAGQIYSQK